VRQILIQYVTGSDIISLFMRQEVIYSATKNDMIIQLYSIRLYMITVIGRKALFMKYSATKNDIVYARLGDKKCHICP
jgi:hypothetical protein